MLITSQAFELRCNWSNKDPITYHFVNFHRRYVEDEQARAWAQRDDPFEVQDARQELIQY